MGLRYHHNIKFDIDPMSSWEIVTALPHGPTITICQVRNRETGTLAIAKKCELENKEGLHDYKSEIDKLTKCHNIIKLADLYYYESYLWIFFDLLDFFPEDSQTTDRSLNESVRSLPERRDASLGNPVKLLTICSVLGLLSCFLFYHILSASKPDKNNQKLDYSEVIEKKLQHIEGMSRKDKAIITSAVDSMSKEVAVLLLLGKSRDTKCTKFTDTAYCLGREIVNTLNGLGNAGTDLDFAIIDGSMKGYKQFNESMYSALVDQTFPSILVDNIESMSGDAALALMQIDPDVKILSQHLVVLMAYFDPVKLHEENVNKLAEELLESKWSKSLSDDKIPAILSRITGNVVKL